MFGYFPGGWVVVVVVKSNNSANSAQLSSASQLELSLAINIFNISFVASVVQHHAMSLNPPVQPLSAGCYPTV